ncbi:MAG: MFS transporter [Actinophytocola sp.]|nr:MFS transporter [Actinophytocola sp.]
MSRDGFASSGAAFAFSFALSISAVAMPLLGLAAGYSAAAVGAIIAVSGVAQFVVRLCLGLVLRKVADRTLITVAGVALVVSNLVVVLSTALVPFLIAQVLQGAARAGFWTGTQTHVVRSNPSAVNAIAGMNLAASFAMLVGPYLAGVLAERDINLALLAAAAVAAVAVGLTYLLDRLSPFHLTRGQIPKRIWRRSGVSGACWASMTTGAWRGLLGSYIPIVLEAAQQPPTMIGALVSIANVAVLIGSGLLARDWAARWSVVAMATLAAGVGTAATGFAAGSVTLAAAALATSGLGAGMLQTLGPAMATESVKPQEVGEAIVATGTFRAAAMFAGPLTVAGALAVLGVTVSLGLAAVGALISLPALTARTTAREQR